ncbi:MAG: AsmA family protein, partial [Pseudomonadota bacterium]
PPYVDWNQFKDAFETQASRVLGQPVDVRGAADVRLLPLPTVTFNDVVVGDPSKAGPKLKAQSFSMNLELAPLLRGNVVIVDMTLNQPSAELVFDKNGQLDWIARAPDLPITLSGDDVQVEKISVIDGRIAIRDDAQNRRYLFDALNFTASAKTLVGPWRLSGRVRSALQKGSAGAQTGTAQDPTTFETRFQASTGRWQSDKGQMSLRVTAEPKHVPYNVQFSGPFTLKNGVPSATGKVLIRPASPPTDEDRIAFPRPPVSDALPVRIEADAALAADGVQFPAIIMDVGPRDAPYQITGSAQLNFDATTSFRATLEGPQVNLEQLQSDDPKPANTGTKNPSLALYDRIAAIRTLAEKLPRVGGDVSIHVFLPAVVAGDTVVRDVGLDLKPAPNTGGQGWALESFEAKLPGRTDVRASGVLILGDKPSYDGALDIASNQPSGLAAWLGIPDDQALRDMARLRLTAKSLLKDTALRFDDMTLVLADNTLRGALARTTGPNASTFDLDLAGPTINLDHLTATYRLFSQNRDAIKKEGAVQKETEAAPDVLKLLTEGQRTLKLRADTLTLGDTAAKGADISLAMNKDQLAIERLSLEEIAGIKVKLSGTATGFQTAGLRLNGQSPHAVALQADISGQSLREALILAEKSIGPLPDLAHFKANPALSANTRLSVRLSGGENALDIAVSGETGGTTVDGKAQGIRLTTGGWQVQKAANVTLSNPASNQLLRQLSLSVSPVADIMATDGAGSVRVAFKRTNGRLQSEGALVLKEGFVGFQGPLEYRVEAGALKVQGPVKLNGTITAFEPIATRFALQLPDAPFRDTATWQTTLDVKEKEAAFRNIAFEMGDVTVAGDVTLKTPTATSAERTSAKPTLTGALTINQLPWTTPLAWVHGRSPETKSLGTTSLEATNRATNPEKAGTQNPLDLVDGTLDLTITTLVDGDGAASVRAQNVKASATLRDGDLSLSDIQGTLGDGRFSGVLNLGKTIAGRFMNGQFVADGVPASTLEDILRARAPTAPKSLAATVGGSLSFDATAPWLEANGKPGNLLSNVTGTGTLVLSEGTIRGLNAAAFLPILRKADSLPDDTLQGQGRAIAEQFLFNGQYSFAATQVPFSISGGVLRANALRLTNPSSELRADVRLDLADALEDLPSEVSTDEREALQIDAKIRFLPGLEKVAGAEPELSLKLTNPGPLDERPADVSIDAALLDSYLGLRLSEKRER